MIRNLHSPQLSRSPSGSRWHVRAAGALVSLLALLVMLAGCGGAESSPPSDPTTAVPTRASETISVEPTTSMEPTASPTSLAGTTLPANAIGPTSSPASFPGVEEVESARGAQRNKTTYIVQEGDTLSGIAALHNTTVGALIEANRLDSADLIYVGQVLKIEPPGAVAESQAPLSPPAQAAISTRVYSTPTPAPILTVEPAATDAPLPSVSTTTAIAATEATFTAITGATPVATEAATAVAQAPASTPVLQTKASVSPVAPTEPVPGTSEPVQVNGRTYDAYIPAAIKEKQWYQYTCEFDAVWIIMKTYGYDVSLEKQIELIGLDKSIEPYVKETAEGIVIYGGDVTRYYSGDYKKNFLARSSGQAIRKVFDAYGLGVTPVRDRPSLEAALLRGELIWIKTTVDFKPWKPARWVMPDGRSYMTVLGNDHALVVMGFNKDGVVIRDPLGPTSTGRQRKYEYEVPWEQFMASWGAQQFDGLAVAPPHR